MKKSNFYIDPNKMDLYNKYYEQERKKLGFDEKYDYKNYVGSALARKPNLSPEVDAEYLKGLLPKVTIVKEDILDVLEEKCISLMRLRASQGKLSCKYPVPQFISGLPLIHPKRVVGPLSERLSKREGLKVDVIETEEAFFIEINWK